MNIGEVARRAGVSRSTVSYALSPAAADRNAAGLCRQRPRGGRPSGPGRTAVALRRRPRPVLRARHQRPTGRRRDPDEDPTGGCPGCPAPADRSAVRDDRAHRPTGRHLLGGSRLRVADRSLRPSSRRSRAPARRPDQPLGRTGRRRLRAQPPGAARLRGGRRRTRPRRKRLLLCRRGGRRRGVHRGDSRRPTRGHCRGHRQ